MILKAKEKGIFVMGNYDLNENYDSNKTQTQTFCIGFIVNSGFQNVNPIKTKNFNFFYGHILVLYYFYSGYFFI